MGEPTRLPVPPTPNRRFQLAYVLGQGIYRDDCTDIVEQIERERDELLRQVSGPDALYRDGYNAALEKVLAALLSQETQFISYSKVQSRRDFMVELARTVRELAL